MAMEPYEVNRWLLSGDNKNKNYFFFYNMKCKDVLDKETSRRGWKWNHMTWIEMDCYWIAIAAWWEVYGSEDLWDALIGSRDLDHDRLSIREGWLVIVVIAASGMTWRHDSRTTIWIWNSMTWESIALMELVWHQTEMEAKRWMLSDRRVEMGF